MFLACLLVFWDLDPPGKCSAQEAPLTQNHGTLGCRPGCLDCSSRCWKMRGGVVLAEMSLVWGGAWWLQPTALRGVLPGSSPRGRKPRPGLWTKTVSSPLSLAGEGWSGPVYCGVSLPSTPRTLEVPLFFLDTLPLPRATDNPGCTHPTSGSRWRIHEVLKTGSGGGDPLS